MKNPVINIIIEGRSSSADTIPPHLAARYVDIMAEEGTHGMPDSIERFVGADGVPVTEIVMRLDDGNPRISEATYEEHFSALAAHLARHGAWTKMRSVLDEFETSPVGRFEIQASLLPGDVQRELVERHGFARDRLDQLRVVAAHTAAPGWQIDVDGKLIPAGSLLHAAIVDEVERLELGKDRFLYRFRHDDTLADAQEHVGAPPARSVEIVRYLRVDDEDEIPTRINRHRPRSGYATPRRPPRRATPASRVPAPRERGPAFNVLILLLFVTALGTAGFWFLFRWWPAQG